MSAATTLMVGLGSRSYPILIGSSLLPDIGHRLVNTLSCRRAVLVCDKVVAKHYAPIVEESLGNAGITYKTVVVPAGEASKSFSQLEKLCEDILGWGIDRKTVLIALGGGVVGDLGGLTASLLLRGIPYVQIPTTLLAQVDSAVGGKTAIDSRHGKNLVGSFYQPQMVVADTDALSTLPAREVRAGYAEVVKYGVIRDATFFSWLENNGPALLNGDTALLQRAIYKCCAMKAEIVGDDEHEQAAGKDKDGRALLNFGHTFGHAFEQSCGFDNSLLHGEAVSVGMVMALKLSARLGYCGEEKVAHVAAHLRACGMPAGLEDLPKLASSEKLVQSMLKDKKAMDGKLVFILARGIGDAFVAQNVPAEEVIALLEEERP